MPGSIKLTVTRLRLDTAKVSRREKAAATRGAMEAADFLLRQARRVVPYDTGALSESGRVDVSDGEASVSFNTVYARRQHFELTWRHAPGRTALYLSRPAQQYRDAIAQIMARELRRAF